MIDEKTTPKDISNQHVKEHACIYYMTHILTDDNKLLSVTCNLTLFMLSKVLTLHKLTIYSVKQPISTSRCKQDTMKIKIFMQNKTEGYLQLIFSIEFLFFFNDICFKLCNELSDWGGICASFDKLVLKLLKTINLCS